MVGRNMSMWVKNVGKLCDLTKIIGFFWKDFLF